jgi:hypothetical protein
LPTDSVLRDQALAKVKRKLANSSETFKAIAPIGEVKELRSLVKTTAEATSNVLKTLINLKHGHVKIAKADAPKAAADAWLQFSFGISPTIADANQLARAINDHMFREGHLARCSGSASKRWVEPRPQDNESISGSAWSGINYRYSRSMLRHYLQYRFTTGVFFPLRSANNYQVNHDFGLTFGDIVPGLWELTPHSWVFDYFTTVGEWLEDTFVSSGGNTVFCTESILYKGESIQKIVPYRTSGFQILEMPETQVQSQWVKRYHRYVLPSLPHRALRVRTLDEIGVNGVKRVLNLASVLISGSKIKR